MKKALKIIIAVIAALIIAVAVFFALSGRKPETVIHCYEFSAAYDYARDFGYDTYIIYGAKPPEFGLDEDLFGYEETQGGLMITSYSGDGVEVYVPKEHNGKQVIGISQGVFDGVKVKEIYIPYSVSLIQCTFD
ncbi:MAG: hypothetical protein IK085_07955 [Clostridia bacterium]|nr:hypothetical protein [Clostridia bacterium]